MLGTLAFTAAPALAAAPETPTLTVEEPVHATGATLHGVLNPGKEGEPGTYEMDEYEFVYKASKTKACKGESTAPVLPGLSLGGGKEEVSQSLEGLTQDTEYAVCLVVHNAAKTEEAVSPAVTFTTAIPPETPDGLKAEPVTITTATLHGVLNPKAPGNPGTYEFLYRQSATEGCEGGEASGGSAGGGKEEAPELELTGLPRGTTYTFCLRARNEADEEALSAPVTFTTLASPPMITSESVSTVEATAATFEAKIKPEGAATTYRFEYLTEAQFKANGESFAGATSTLESESIGADEAEHAVTARIKGLTPNTTYHYKVIATNKLAPAGVPGGGQEFTTREGPTATAETCPNKQRRAEQPFGLTLPDCRAYEMVSPVNTEGQNATEEEYDKTARAAEEGAPAQPTTEPVPQDEGGAVTYAASGSFAGTSAQPPGATVENQYVSRRDPKNDRWSTQAVTPIHEPDETETIGSYVQDAFTPQLTEGIVRTNAPLTEGAHKSQESGGEREEGLYVADFANRAYHFVVEAKVPPTEGEPLGASTELSHVVFGEHSVHGAREKVLEWDDGIVVPVSVTNNEVEGLGVSEALGEAVVAGWRGVSADGSRVYLTTGGQLFERVNAEQPQSPIASPEASGTGSLIKGSEEVTGVISATGDAGVEVGEGSTEYPVGTTSGRFVVGEVVSGPAIKPGTEIVKITPSSEPFNTGQYRFTSSEILTLSAPTVAGSERGTEISSEGPAPFEAGQKVVGNGIPSGTTIVEAAKGRLTLSRPASSSGSGEALYAGGECTVPTDACTVLVSAPQRQLANPAGTQPVQYWGASADGSRVFFTSTAELTEDAYTGPAAEGANLYEYELATNTLTDLTASDHSGAGADVQGVAQISEDGSYVYFVADGDLGGEAQEGEPNLYVSHDGGEARFVVTLGGEDGGVWGTSPESNLASVSANGEWLAFLSKAAGLTGYDNEAVRESECQGEVGFANQNEEEGHCQEAYLYDAASGRLVCASCNPTGARPAGPANLGEPRGSQSLYRPRVVTNEGTLFFGSYDKLVPGADGLQNVYEYEDGHVLAISDVSGGYGSFLLDTSANGGDVFFATSDKLLPEDRSDNVVVYDARVDGGFPIPPAAPSCDSGDSCKPPPSAQPAVFGAPASATFSGPGNVTPPAATKVTTKQKTAAELKAEELAKALKVCRKDKKKLKRAKCEKRAHKKYAPVKAKKKKATKSADTDRRTRS